MTTLRNLRQDRCKACIHYRAGSCPGLVDNGICDDYERGPERHQVVAGLAALAGVVGLIVLAVMRFWGGR